MAKHARAIKGDIVFSDNPNSLKTYKDGYIILFGNIIRGVYDELPNEYKDTRLFDYGGKLIIPSFNNLFMILKQDYLKKREIIKELWQEGVLRFNIVSVDDLENSYTIMDYIESLGLGAYCAHQRKRDSQYSIYDIDEFSVMSANQRILVKPFIFIEEDDEFFIEKTKLSDIYNINIVGKNIHKSKHYEDLDKESLLNIIDIDNSIADFEILRDIKNNAYNPYYSIDNRESKKLLKELLYSGRLGIYTDERYSILDAIRYEINNNNNNNIFSLNELFYMTSINSGKFYGNIGSFKEFYSFDACIIDDSKYSNTDNLEERLHNFLKFGKKEDIIMRYAYGMKALGE